MKHKGFTLTETLIVGSVFGLFVLAGTLLLTTERARTRDAKRIADMTRISAGFALLYGQKASYSDAAVGCPTVGAPAATCTLTNVVTGLDAVKDPGRFAYTVSRVPDKDDFTITFRLERAYGTLPAGQHTLSKSGIR
jgi:type II secretory pathway pseudopilin PulG